MSEFFEETMKYARNAKAVCNWLLSDISAWLNKHEKTIDNCDLKPQNLAKLVSLIDAGEVSNAQAKKLVDDLMAGKDPQKSAEEKGLRQVSDTGAIEKMVTEVLDANPQAIEDFKNGKDRAVGFLVGQVMKKSRGQANPGMVNKMVRDALKSRI